MKGGAKFCALASGLAVAGCQAAPAALEIRALANPADKIRSGSAGLADARAQLALGNVGLALEAFRKGLRETPDNPEAYAGIAKCYEAMGRYDLARKNYEAALAFAPRDPGLLSGFAVAAATAAAPAPAPAQQQVPVANVAPEAVETPAIVRRTLPAPAVDVAGSARSLGDVRQLRALALAGPSITVELPPARPAPASVAVAALVRREAAVVAAQQPVKVPPARPRELPEPSVDVRATAVPIPRAGQLKILASAGPSITVELPEVPLARHRELPQSAVDVRATAVPIPRAGQLKILASAGPSITVELPPARPAAVASQDARTRAIRAFAASQGPRLERLSPGEVALVTTGRPLWRGQLLAQARSTATPVRWVPLTKMASRPNIRLLNAAQRQGLAAQSRAMLLDRGWRKIEIGNALDVRNESMVIYPASRRTLARSLAAQFGLATLVPGKGDVLIVLLGRDAPRRAAFPKRG